MEKDKILKIAMGRFEAGYRVAYIHLWGDPNRIRNYAGAWIKNLGDSYEVTTVGRLFGSNPEPHIFTLPTLEEAAERILIIWESYDFESL